MDALYYQRFFRDGERLEDSAMLTTFAIGSNTFREAVRQRVYWAILLLTVALMGLSVVFAAFAFGDESKLVTDAGLTSITIAGLLLAVFLSSSVVGDEIEQKTALTVLSKPVHRLQFVIGKYAGVFAAITGAFLILAVALLVTVWWHDSPVRYLALAKACGRGEPLSAQQLAFLSGGYADLHSAGKAIPFSLILSCLTADISHFLGSMSVRLLAGVGLSLCEAAILASAGVAVSTRLSRILTACILFGLFVLGHQAGYFVHALAGEWSSHALLASTLLRIIPNLEFLNYASDIAFGRIIPIPLLGQLVLYSAGWVAVFLLLAGILFSRRELA